MTTTKNPAFDFFLANAGYSYGPNETPNEGRRRCAWNLVKAEAWASENGYRFNWVPDDSDCGDGDYTPEVREGCIMMLDGETIESLWGIGDADESYRRVVEAELAYQAMENL